MTPRPYQVEARSAVHKAWQQYQRVLVVHPTGTGKTVLFSLIADDILRHGGRVLILAHRHELLQQAQQKLMSVTGIDSVVEKAEETAYGSLERVTVGSVQTMMNLSRLERFPRNYYSHIVVDECHHCFPAGTLIDGKRIENIHAGDLVCCYDHERNKPAISFVERTMSRDVDSICEVFLSNGKTLVCTEDHPIFNGTNYVAASTLSCNDMVYEQIHESKDLFGLRRCIRAEVVEQLDDSVLFGTVQEKGKRRSKKNNSSFVYSMRYTLRLVWKKIVSGFKRKNVLQQGMQQAVCCKHKFDHNGEHKQKICIGQNETEQPHEESRCEEKNDSFHDWKAPEDPRRKRIGYPCPASSFMDRNSRIGVSWNYGTSDMYSTSVSSVSSGEVGPLLQTGHSVSSRESIYRDRWVFPLLTKKETTGRKENSGLVGVRVEGVAIHKRGRGKGFDRLCPGGCVYNLQVAYHNNYFAENILVHNCLTDSYQRIFAYFENAKVLGVTATPDRGDLKDLGRFFETKAHEYLLPQAIADGYLCKIRAQMIPLNIDLNNVKCGTDFDDVEVGNALKPYIPQIATELWKVCKNRKLLIFAPLCAIAQDIRDAMAKVGFNSFYASGEHRDEMKAWNAAGKGACMVNAMLLTEGYDHPLIDAVCVLRPTKVRALYCLSEDTEILTDSGWKQERYVDVMKDLAAAFNPNDESISYVKITGKVRRLMEPGEKWVSIKTQSCDIKVTDNHRMLYDHKRRTGWKFKTANDLSLLRDTNYIPAAGIGKLQTGVPLSDDEIRFIGWVMTDGTINPKNGQITITQGEHQPWLEEIEKCIVGCGFKFTRFIRVRNSQFKSNSKCIAWTISFGKPRGRDKHLRGWGSISPWLSKNFSPMLMDVSPRQFEILTHSMHLGDGDKQVCQCWTRRSYHISTANKLYADRLQITATLCGWRANISTYSYNKNPIHKVHLKKQPWHRIGGHSGDRPPWFVSRPEQDERCWCVENNIGTLITRRNGKVAIVGNCQMIGRGTRIHPLKDYLLVPDFLWHSERHSLCHPAHLLAENDEVAEIMVKKSEATAGGEPEDVDTEALAEAQAEFLAQKEEVLAKKLSEQRRKKAKLVDPLQFAMSIGDEGLADYQPTMQDEGKPATLEQMKFLEEQGLSTTEMTQGLAHRTIEALTKRKSEGMALPKQIRFLERMGFKHVGKMKRGECGILIGRISANNWRVPENLMHMCGHKVVNVA